MNRVPGLMGKKVGDVRWPIRCTRPTGPTRALRQDAEFVQVLKWLREIDPAVDRDNVGLGDCAVENGCRRIAVDDFRCNGVFRQVEAPTMYQAIRRDLYGNLADEGLDLKDLPKWWLKNGVIKPDCTVTEVEISEPAINAALAVAPLICGQYALGIMPAELSAFGWFDESTLGDAWSLLMAGGHCMLLGASFVGHAGVRCHVWKNGGWGAYGLLGEGCGLSTTGWTVASAIARPLLITHQSENIVGPDYLKWVKK